MLKWFARFALAKKAYDWYTGRKNSSNQSGGSIRKHRLGD